MGSAPDRAMAPASTGAGVMRASSRPVLPVSIATCHAQTRHSLYEIARLGRS